MSLKPRLTAASALAVLFTTGAAQAASPTMIYAGGGSTAAKVYRDVFNCYVTAADGIYATTPGNQTTVAYPVTLSPACAKQGTVNDVLFYNPVTAPLSLQAFTEASPVPFGAPATTNTVAYLDSNVGVTSTPYPEIQWAGSDIYLNATQASQAVATVGEPIFQIPVFVSPMGLPVGQVQNVKLVTNDICNIFASATNKSAAGVTFSEIVYRTDATSSNFVLSDWLVQNCSASLGFTSANGFPSPSPSFTAVAALNGNHISFLGVKGSGGMASTVGSTKLALGYVTVDYLYPIVPSSTAYSSFVNGVQPTVAAVKTRLRHESYPSTYNAATIGQQLNDQLVAPGYAGYPFVSFSFIDAYECYSTSIAGGLIGGPAQGTALRNLLNIFYNGAASPVINQDGYVPVPAQIPALLKTTGGPLTTASGLQNASCPSM